MSEGRTDRSSFVVNGHSIVLKPFKFVCENDQCELEGQAHAAIRHVAANTTCPAEKEGDGGLRAGDGTVEDSSDREEFDGSRVIPGNYECESCGFFDRRDRFDRAGEDLCCPACGSLSVDSVDTEQDQSRGGDDA